MGRQRGSLAGAAVLDRAGEQRQPSPPQTVPDGLQAKRGDLARSRDENSDETRQRVRHNVRRDEPRRRYVRKSQRVCRKHGQHRLRARRHQRGQSSHAECRPHFFF